MKELFVVVVVFIALVLFSDGTPAQPRLEETCVTVAEGYPELGAGIIVLHNPRTTVFLQGSPNRWEDVVELARNRAIRIIVCGEKSIASR